MPAWLLANINRDSDMKAEPFTLEEVVAWLGHGFQPRPSVPQTPDVEMLAQKMQTLNTLYNGDTVAG
jgi:hypothetical protein